MHAVQLYCAWHCVECPLFFTECSSPPRGRQNCGPGGKAPWPVDCACSQCCGLGVVAMGVRAHSGRPRPRSSVVIWNPCHGHPHDGPSGRWCGVVCLPWPALMRAPPIWGIGTGPRPGPPRTALQVPTPHAHRQVPACQEPKAHCTIHFPQCHYVIQATLR